MKFRPLKETVLVKIFKEDQQPKLPSGIVLPTPLRKVPLEGEVITVGEGPWDAELKVRVSLQVKVGNRVVFRRNAGQYFELEGEKYLLLRESDIWGVIER